MKAPVDIQALNTRHSFSGEGTEFILELKLLGYILHVPVEEDVIAAIDEYIAQASRTNQAMRPSETSYVERKEYPTGYDEGVDYELGTISLADMEEL